MSSILPKTGGVPCWHKATFGKSPFPGDAPAAAAAFFRPAASLCRRAVPAEKFLPAVMPSGLRKELGLALRFWQVSQEITEDFILRGKFLPRMDMPMTLNFAMALGNYSRFMLFSRNTRLTPKAAAALHAAFAKEMTGMPAALALRRAMKGRRMSPRETVFSERYSPAASAARLAAAFAAGFKRKAHEN